MAMGKGYDSQVLQKGLSRFIFQHRLHLGHSFRKGMRAGKQLECVIRITHILEMMELKLKEVKKLF